MPPDTGLLQRLRAARNEELLGTLTAPAPPTALPAEQHRVSLTQVHDDLRAVLSRIDAAEAAMRPILRAWEDDPARRGAHLLAAEAGSASSGADSVHGEHQSMRSPSATQVSAPAIRVSEADQHLPDTLLPDDWPGETQPSTKVDP